MLRPSYLLFDLDGTLVDSKEGIYASVLYALQRLGLPAADESVLRKMIGPPLRESFRNFFALSEDDADEAVRQYRELYSSSAMFLCTAYPGVSEMLSFLSRAGFHLLVATSKPERFAVPILKHLSLANHFSLIAGSTLDKSRDDKSSVIAYALASSGLPRGGRALMVGDRHHDVEGAHANGLPAAGVLYGYGSLQELSSAGAELIVHSPDELCRIVSDLPEK